MLMKKTIHTYIHVCVCVHVNVGMWGAILKLNCQCENKSWSLPFLWVLAEQQQQKRQQALETLETSC